MNTYKQQCVKESGLKRESTYMNFL